MYRNSDRRAFTLVELLVCLFVISLLLSILVPALRTSFRHARRLISKNNQRLIVMGVDTYSCDNDNRYPDSVATIGTGDSWGWQEPTILVSYEKRNPQTHRSISAYLYGYISSSTIMACCNAPRNYPYLRPAWEAKDSWDCPLPGTRVQDPLYGVYCFYWNYVGYLPASRTLFRGPTSSTSDATDSRVLISDYLCLGCSRHPNSVISCEPLPNAESTDYMRAQTSYVMDVWIMDFGLDRSPFEIDDFPQIRLQAAYQDGHVETYYPSDTERMQVSITSDGYQPYSSSTGPGDLFVPSSQP